MNSVFWSVVGIIAVITNKSNENFEWPYYRQTRERILNAGAHYSLDYSTFNASEAH